MVKKAQALPAAKRRSSSGRLRCCVGGEPARARTESNLRDRTECEAAERTSAFAERAALRGEARNGRPIVVGALRSRRAPARCRHEKRKGQPSSSRACRHDTGCAAGSRRGFARRKSREPSLGSVGPRASRIFGCVLERGSMLSLFRKEGQRANVGVKHVASHRGRGSDASQLLPVHRRSAEVVRPFSGSEKRALGSERVESPNEAGGGRTGA